MYYGYNNNFARASRFFVDFFAVTTRLQSSFFFFYLGRKQGTTNFTSL